MIIHYFFCCFHLFLQKYYLSGLFTLNLHVFFFNIFGHFLEYNFLHLLFTSSLVTFFIERYSACVEPLGAPRSRLKIKTLIFLMRTYHNS